MVASTIRTCGENTCKNQKKWTKCHTLVQCIVYSKAKYRKQKIGIIMDWTNRLYISVFFKFIWWHNPFNGEI